MEQKTPGKLRSSSPVEDIEEDEIVIINESGTAIIRDDLDNDDEEEDEENQPLKEKNKNESILTETYLDTDHAVNDDEVP